MLTEAVPIHQDNGGLPWENVLSGVRPAKTQDAQSDQSLRCAPVEASNLWSSKGCPMKTLIRMRGGAGWSESLLGAPVRGYISYKRAVKRRRDGK